MIRDIIRFIFSMDFIKNLLLYLVVITVILLATFIWLRFYTNHNDLIQVPDLYEYSIFEAGILVENANLRMEVQDSVYIPDHMPGRVLQQNPVPYTIDETGDTIAKFVKENRKIYVTTTRITPPMKVMPNLIDKSERIALIKLETAGLKIGNIEYVPSSIGANLILDQKYQGRSIVAGTPIRMNEQIDLVVSRATVQKTEIPDLFGLKNSEARKLLNANSLNLGLMVECIGCVNSRDSSLARIFEQRPAYGSEKIGIGSSIDVFLTLDTIQFQKLENLLEGESFN